MLYAGTSQVGSNSRQKTPWAQYLDKLFFGAQIPISDKGLFLTLQISAWKFAGLPFHLCFCWLHQVALKT